MPDLPTTAIHFHPDAVEGEGKDLVGRRSAGQSFLRGYLKHACGDRINATVNDAAGQKTLTAILEAMGEKRPATILPLHANKKWEAFGTLFLPVPNAMKATWTRQHRGAASCSFVGITHTVSTRRVMEGFHAFLSEPVEPWDALICTSRAVHSVVSRQFEEEAAFIRQRYGASRVPQPQLPIIPLGIHTSDFTRTDPARARMRARFDVPAHAIVIMTMGRLTSVEKANMVPLYLALEEVAQRTGKEIHLWQVGWPSREEEARIHSAAPPVYCPSVKARIIDGRDALVRREIWSGADIFTLPVDIIQETFGLVPVEAMAAGLPVVMPDWNGFRDTVAEGETGFLIPTRMAAPDTALGRTLARRFADGRDPYLAHLSMVQQMTMIDLPTYAARLADLVENPDLRARMGQAGQRHARTRFDWKAVMPQYLDLARDLQARRAGAKTETTVNPLCIDPFELYARYPTAPISLTDVVTHHRRLDAGTLEQLSQLSGRTIYKREVLGREATLDLARRIEASGSVSAKEIVELHDGDPEQVLAGILFLAKFGFVTLAPQRSK